MLFLFVASELVFFRFVIVVDLVVLWFLCVWCFLLRLGLLGFLV
jgi:hypothetical protein